MICPKCNGRKTIDVSYQVGEEGMKIDVDAEYTCPVCKGDGVIDLRLITELQFDGIDRKDHPDYCDAYIVSAKYKGEEADEELIEALNDDAHYVHTELWEHLH